MRSKFVWPSPPPQKDTEGLLRQWLYQGQVVISPIGEKVTVLGFEKKYLQRGGFDHKRAGVYFNFLRVRVTNNTMDEYAANALEVLSNDSCPDQQTLEKIGKLLIRIGDLPNTPFWEGDTVEYNDQETKLRLGRLVVTNIDYSACGGRRGNELYGLSFASDGKPLGHQHGSALNLVERGNIWKLEHDEPLSFPGETEWAQLLEEAAFYKSLGMSHKIIFTDTESELWPIGGGIRELQKGRADRLIPKNKETQEVVLIKYDNEEFGNRMRAAELKRLGFENNPAPTGVHMMGYGVKSAEHPPAAGVFSIRNTCGIPKIISTIFYTAQKSDASQDQMLFELNNALASFHPPEHFSLQNLIFLTSTKR